MIIFPKKDYIHPLLFSWLPKLPTLEQLMSWKYNKNVIEKNKETRRLNRLQTNGYTPNRNQRLIAEIPYEVVVNPEMGKYFQKGQDKHERKKNLWKFLQKYPEYKTVEKL